MSPFLRNIVLVAAFALMSISGFTQNTTETTTDTEHSLIDPIATAAASTGTVERHRTAESAPATTATVSRGFPALSTQTVVLASWNGGSMTNHELSATLQLRRPRSAVGELEQVLRLSTSQLGEVIKDLVYERLQYEEARAAGITEETSSIRTRLDEFRGTVLNRLYAQREIEPRLKKMDEAAAREYYESRKEKIFTAPEILLIREIFLSAYQVYKAKQGDTLESIAAEVSKDAAAVARILRNDGTYTLRSHPAKDPYPPVLQPQPGESLLVPMAKDDITSLTRRAEELLSKVKNGEDFGALATSNSAGIKAGSAFIPNFEGMQPNLRTAILALEKSAVSDVLSSRHGLHIFRLEDRKATRTLSFDEVKDKIIGTFEEQETAQHAQKVQAQLFDDLAKKYNLVINTDALRKQDYGGADPLTANTTIASTDDFSYTLDEYLKDLLPTTKSWSGMTYEERLNVVKGARKVVRYLVARDAEALDLDKTEDFQKQMQSRAIIEVTTEYRKDKVSSRVSDAALRDYYSANIERYTSPSLMTVREITKKLNMGGSMEERRKQIESAKRALSELKSKIRNVEDFQQAARRESEAIETRSRGGLIGKVPADFRGPTARNELLQIKPGEMTEPFVYGTEVMLLFLESATPATPIPFEEALRAVRQDYMREVPGKKLQQERDQALERAGFKLLI